MLLLQVLLAGIAWAGSDVSIDISGAGQGPIGDGANVISDGAAAGGVDFRLEWMKDGSALKAPNFGIEFRAGPSTANFVSSNEQEDFAAQVAGLSPESANVSFAVRISPPGLSIPDASMRFGSHPHLCYLASSWKRTQLVDAGTGAGLVETELYSANVGIISAQLPVTFEVIADDDKNKAYAAFDIAYNFRTISTADDRAAANALGFETKDGSIRPVRSQTFHGLGVDAMFGLNNTAWVVRLGRYWSAEGEDVAGLTNTYFIMGPALRTDFVKLKGNKAGADVTPM